MRQLGVKRLPRRRHDQRRIGLQPRLERRDLVGPGLDQQQLRRLQRRAEGGERGGMARIVEVIGADDNDRLAALLRLPQIAAGEGRDIGPRLERRALFRRHRGDQVLSLAFGQGACGRGKTEAQRQDGDTQPHGGKAKAHAETLARATAEANIPPAANTPNCGGFCAGNLPRKFALEIWMVGC